MCALHGALASTSAATEAVVAEQPGDQVGRYKLLEKIGEGGCGVVYLAEQTEPIRRRVALKVVKLGMDTKQVIARFEAERQVLALMDHPHIAKVLDAGATETGRPYFVMELVRGVKITDHCDQNHLSTGERLDLFIQVCQAVQHAHQKGIIHRDLKPSNILVTLHDGVPVPKVIDFGIAKATAQQQLTDRTLFTAFQQFIGTPAYMSPEQAGMTRADTDTRSDIYSLGVLLYELLTGHLPFERNELLEVGFDEMRRMICETEPTRPSTRLVTLSKEDLTMVARRHRIEPPKLIHLLRGDLDWIVMKCLEKDRARRYETANALADDLGRHLNHEAVLAAAPGTLYRLGKFVRRYRYGIATAALMVLLLVAGLLASLWQAVRATRAEQETKANLTLQQKARENAENAESALRLAEVAREQSKVELENALQVARTERASVEAAKRVAEAAESHALASLQQATNAQAVALVARDESLRQQAKVEDFIGFMLFDLSDKLRPLGQADLLREVTLKVSAHYQTLTNQDNSELALARRYAVSKNLAYALAAQGDTITAERHYQASLAIAEKLSAREVGGTTWLAERLACHERIGEIWQTRGNSAAALAEFRQSLAIANDLVAGEPENPAWQEGLLTSHLKVGDVLWKQGDHPGTLTNYQVAVKIALGAAERNPHATGNRYNLALSYRKMGAFLLRQGNENKALKACSESLKIARKLAVENPGNSGWQAGLAASLDSLGDVFLVLNGID